MKEKLLDKVYWYEDMSIVNDLLILARENLELRNIIELQIANHFRITKILQ
jgi:hypothetical protein